LFAVVLRLGVESRNVAGFEFVQEEWALVAHRMTVLVQQCMHDSFQSRREIALRRWLSALFLFLR
jgi:hypothetical protein